MVIALMSVMAGCSTSSSLSGDSTGRATGATEPRVWPSKTLKKYLLAITDGKDKNKSPYDTYILESDRLTGPSRLVSFMREFKLMAPDPSR